MNPECCLAVMCAHACVSYLEGEPVLAGAEPHVLHGGAVDHHLSHTLAGHKHWSAGFKQKGMGFGEKKRDFIGAALVLLSKEQM